MELILLTYRLSDEDFAFGCAIGAMIELDETDETRLTRCEVDTQASFEGDEAPASIDGTGALVIDISLITNQLCCCCCCCCCCSLLVACCLGLLRLICVCAMRETSNRFALSL